MDIKWLSVLLSLIIGSAYGKLFFVDSQNTNFSSGFTSVFHKFIGPPPQDLDGEVALSSPFDACQEIQNMKGLIVLATEGKRLLITSCYYKDQHLPYIQPMSDQRIK